MKTSVYELGTRATTTPQSAQPLEPATPQSLSCHGTTTGMDSPLLLLIIEALWAFALHKCKSVPMETVLKLPCPEGPVQRRSPKDQTP